MTTSDDMAEYAAAAEGAATGETVTERAVTVVAEALYADRLRWETKDEPTVHRVTTHDRALSKKVLAALAAADLLAATPGEGFTEEWAVDYRGGNWQDRGWYRADSREDAERRASKRLAARVMRRRETAWEDVTPQWVIQEAADRSRAKHGIKP